MHDMYDLQCLNAGITPGCYRFRLCQSEKSCKQRFGVSQVGDVGRSRKRCLVRPSSRRGGPEPEASAVPLWPGLLVGEAGRSRKRALFLFSEAL